MINYFMLKTQFKFIITIVLVLGLSISLQSLLASWQAPISGPPSDNIAQPINTGAFFQKKHGSLDVAGDLGVASDLTVLNNLTTGGTIYTDFLTSSTTGLNIDSGNYGMEFNIDADNSGTDNFVYRVNGIAMMTVSSIGDILAGNNVYANEEVLITTASVDANYYDKIEINTNFYPKAESYSKTEIDITLSDIFTKTEVQALIDSLSIASDSSLDLHNGLHSSSQCTDNSGIITTIGVDDFCRFNGNCLDGWLSGYTTTSQRTCSDTKCSGSTSSCTTGSHSIKDLSTESCTHYRASYTAIGDADCGDKTPGTCGTAYSCSDYIPACYATLSYSYCY